MRCRRIRGRRVCGPFCEPPTGFPVDTPGRAKNAIARAVQFRSGAARDRIIRCACKQLKDRWGIVTKTCRRYGF